MQQAKLHRQWEEVNDDRGATGNGCGVERDGAGNGEERDMPIGVDPGTVVVRRRRRR